LSQPRSSVSIAARPERRKPARHFERQWEVACTVAGITGLHVHDLRGTAVTMLAKAGCTTPEIAAITRFQNAKATGLANQLQTRTPDLQKGKAK